MLNARRFVSIPRLLAACLTLSAVLGAPAIAEDAKTIVDAAQATALRIKPTSGQVSVEAGSEGFDVTIQPGASGYPGVAVSPGDGSAWNLSSYGHIVAKVANTSDQPIRVSLRVDNEGPWQDKPYNVESQQIKPGETGSIKVIFGHSYGHQPAFKLDPSRIKQLMLFTEKAGAERGLRIESIQAAGVAGEAPQRVEKPKPQVKAQSPVLTHGVIFDEDTDAANALTLRAVGGSIVAEGSALLIDFPAADKQHRAAIRPKSGEWNLRDHLEVRVTLTNLGATPLSPRVQVESSKGHTAWATTDRPLAPNESANIVVPFIPATPWQGPEDISEGKSFKGTEGTRFASNITSGVAIEVESTGEAQRLRIDAITAGMPPLQLPDWLGQRPPVEGDWVATFVDEFDSSELDSAKWGVYGSNFWDKTSHFSKDNVILGDGVVRLRYEKKTGYHNDDPAHPRASDYATGYLHTYDKWTQLYGYFEARMKLPTAPGLWPAFWMMPTRDNPADPQWKRQDTADGGMEFDIMEHLTRWGPNRYTTAMHWDGYGKNHKVTGAGVYFQPDKDGYVVAGLLWEPGLLVYYCNGEEVGRWKHERISNVPSDLMFTLPTGGWDNDPLDDAKLPDDFIIDYVRCWQRRERMGP